MSAQAVNRISKLKQELARHEIDAMFISQPENRYYLSGFLGSAGFLFITAERAILATDFRYIEQARIQAPGFEILRISGEPSTWFMEVITSINARVLGFEGEHVSYAFFQRLKDALAGKSPAVKMVPVDGVVEALRAVKEPEEVRLISEAVKISDAAVSHIEGFMQAGMTEREVAWELERFMREQGSQTMPFDIIVASGPNGAMPHAQPSDRAINLGEPVVIDLGARVGGYTSDLTRTLYLGNQDDTFKRVYDVVLGAQLTAIAIIKEGMTGGQADSLARTVIQQAEYGDSFGHGLGHGVGLATHEMPRLGPDSKDILTTGMVVTIEPGVYIPGWGGVRIEDVIIMEDGKARVLSSARKA